MTEIPIAQKIRTCFDSITRYDEDITQFLAIEGNFVLTDVTGSKYECFNIDHLNLLLTQYRSSHVFMTSVGEIVRIPTHFGEYYVMLHILQPVLQNPTEWKFIAFQPTETKVGVSGHIVNVSTIYDPTGQRHQPVMELP